MTLLENEIDLTVVKREGKRVSFNGEKIAIAIKKGFDSVQTENYDEENSNEVYNAVLENIITEYADRKTIKIESIQDIIETKLKELGYEDVYKSFSEYRERRNASRQIFIGRTHKMAKVIESLGLADAETENAKRENANIDGNTSMGTMLQYGSTLSKEFSKSYLMNSKYAEAHDSGQIHIHDMDFMPMGTTTCLQIDLHRLFEKGFSTGHGYLRPPKDIASFGALAAIAIQSNQNDQHGGQSIPAFDYFLAPGVLMTFKRQFKQIIYDYLDLEEYINFVNFKKIAEQIDKLTSIEFDINEFDSLTKDIKRIKEIFVKGYEKAIQKTERATYQSMEAFIHNLNTMHSRAGAQVPFSSINFGTDVSPEGRMVIKNYLLALDSGLGHGETPIFPIMPIVGQAVLVRFDISPKLLIPISRTAAS